MRLDDDTTACLKLKWHTCLYRERFQFETYRHSRWTLFAVEKGMFRYVRGGGEWTEAVPGELVFFPPDESIRREVIEPLRFHFISFDWPTRQAEISFADRFPRLKATIADRPRLFSTMDYLRQACESNDPALRRLVEHLVCDMYVLAQFEKRTNGREAPAARDALMAKVKETIDANGCEGSLKHLAARFHLSPVQLTRRFKAAYGLGPSDYMTNVRLAKVKMLLEETEYTIAHIAHLCGYSDGYYLSRLFAKKLNVTPSVYRKMHRV